MEEASRRLTSRTVLAILLAFLLAASGLMAAGAQEAGATALKAPAKVKIASVKSGSAGKATVKVKKAKRAKGYQYKISQKKNFKGKTTMTAKAKKTSKTFSGLTGGKTYYVKVRAYNKIGKKVKYGKWSAVKTVKVKKKASGGASSSSSSSGSGSDDPDDVEVTAVELSQYEAEIEEYETLTLTASVLPEDATNADITWSTSDESIATVDGGVVTGTGAGLAVITATAATGASADCEVYVSLAGAAEHEQFAQEAFALMESGGVELNPALAEEDPYFLHRLLLEDDGTQIDFEADYGAIGSVRDADGLNVVQFDSSEAAEQALLSLQENEHVIWVEPDSCSQATVGSDSGAAQKRTFHSWGVTRIGADGYADSLVQMGKKGAVIVAVVDTGISAGHPLFEGRVAKGGKDYVNNDDDPADDNRLGYDKNGNDIVTNTYHGTHVSGTVVDCTPGLNVKIMPIKVLNDHGSGDNLWIAKGIKRAVNKGAKVINLSLGGRHNKVLDRAIEYALDHGVTVVVAAGNDSKNTKKTCPAHLAEAIVVGAVDDDDEKAHFSNYGSSVDVVAPGVDIESAMPDDDYQTHDGTSMAAPHIAAAAAMIKLRNPSYSPAKIENTLKECALDLGPSGRDDEYGHGLPDLGNLASIVDSGTWGTCPWTLDEFGVLRIGGGTGEDTKGRSPWFPEHYEGIKKIVVGTDSGTVVFPESSCGLFGPDLELREITFVNVDTSNVTDMIGMFTQCSSLKSLDLSELDTSNVILMNSMFYGCSSLTSLDLSPLDMSNVHFALGMFYGCSSLTSLDLSWLDTSRMADMRDMFEGCSSLSSLITGSGWIYDTIVDGQFPVFPRDMLDESGAYHEKGDTIPEGEHVYTAA